MNGIDIKGDLNDFYDVLVSFQTHILDVNKIVIGKKGQCRFCSNKGDDAFKKEAHSIPEFLGNKRIFNLDECDNCNQFFSKFESELSSFLSPYLVMGQIRGKNGIPKIKQDGFELRRDAKRISVLDSNCDPQDIISYNPLTDRIQIKASLPMRSFRPRYAYKALCKIALSILPEDELNNFKKLREWILTLDDLELFHLLDCRISQTQVHYYLPLVGAYILRRKEDTAQVPYMIFVLMASTFCLQIDLMSDEKDNHIDLLDSSQIQISKKVILGDEGGTRLEINYENEKMINWVSG